MHLKIKSELQATLLITSVAVLFAVFGIASDLWVITSLAGIVALYFVTRAVIHHYVIFRIKPIYQILEQRNSHTSEIASKYAGKDIATELRSELETWAASSQGEIARLKENEQYRKDFVGNVSHELKTPIFSIQGYILTLLEGGLEDSSINRKFLQNAETNIERLINIVRDLEEISRLESSNLKLEIATFSLAELVQEAIESLEYHANEKKIELRIENPEERDFRVSGDRKRLMQVFVNLLSNSINYGRSDGLTVIRFVDLFERVLIEVQDNGQGMERAVLPHIFERFYRVDKGRSRGQGGTGLGLAIVKHILEAHGQTITVRSRLGEGTTFAFTLSL